MILLIKATVVWACITFIVTALGYLRWRHDPPLWFLSVWIWLWLPIILVRRTFRR